MFECFNNIVVSCPNGGGLFLVHDRNVHRLDSLDSTGLAARDRTLVRGIQPALVVVYQNAPLDVNPADIAFDDIHDVLIDGDSLYLVSTSSNEIVQFNFAGVELERWKFAVEDDSWHINSIEKWNGRIVFSAFGEFDQHRGYKGNTAGAGFVQDLRSGKRLIKNLSQPHSLTAVGDHLMVACSETMELMEFGAEGELLRSKNLDGYVRGIHVAGPHVFIGLSRSRNLADGTVQTATIVALDSVSWSVRDTLSLPVNEIYDIQGIAEHDLPSVVAAVGAHTSKLLGGMVSDQGQRLRVLASELDEARRKGLEQLDLLEHTAKVSRLLDSGVMRIEEAGSVLRGGVDTAAQRMQVEVERLQDVSADLRRDVVARGERLERICVSLEERTSRMIEKLVDRSAQEEVVFELMRGLEAERARVVDAENKSRDQEVFLKKLLDSSDASAHALDELRAELYTVQASLADQTTASDSLAVALSEHKSMLMQRDAELAGVRAELLQVYQSASMRITHPARALSAAVRGASRRCASLAKVAAYFANNPRKVVQYAKAAWRLRGDQPHRLALQFIARGGPKPPQEWEHAQQSVLFDLRKSNRPIVILTTKHCAYIGREIAQALLRVNIESEIIFERPASGYADVPHFVICPHMFPELPGFYVAFQLEQSVSSRWFTDDYLRRLENSFAIFDYSKTNIDYLKGRGLSLRQIYYLPIGLLANNGMMPAADETDPGYDVVFYGDANNERRQRYLQELQKICRVRIVREVFDEELYRILAAAKLVVNIHYYPNALLETTRIWESLSLNKLIVSEKSSDMQEHGELNGIVDFVDVDDIEAMVSRVDYWLRHEEERRERIRRNALGLAALPNRFDYFFFRFLLATDNISFDEFWREAGSKYVLTGERLCLNLPEYTDRTKGFATDNKFGFELFPGLRHSQGWLGCAMSYKYMIMLARQHGLKSVTICEDDVEFPSDFESQLDEVGAYLRGSAREWDIFSGLMADLNTNARILAVDRKCDHTFVVTDKLISTVMNIYNGTVFDTITAWDERNRDVHTNTIDRYLEKRKSLKIVTTSPFLVGHKEEQHSTIWGFQNTQYADLIAASTKLLQEKIGEFESRHRWW